MKKLAYPALLTVLISTSIFSLVGYFGNLHWLFDLFVHFKLQYLIILVIGFVCLILLKKKKIFVIFFVPILTNFYDVTSLYFGGNRDLSMKDSLKICSINVLSSNNQFEGLKKLIRAENPDILILQEVNMAWQLMMRNSLADYPYRKEIPREDNFGIALYSKKPIEHVTTLSIGTTEIPSIYCQVNTKNGVLSIIATHPPPPVGKMFTNARNSQLMDLAKITSNTKENFAVFGDLNTSSYSNSFKTLMEHGKLNDSRKGFGIQSSWPTWFSLASTTLDHCLTTKNVVIKSRKIGEDLGSDHLPVIIELGLRKQ